MFSFIERAKKLLSGGYPVWLIVTLFLVLPNLPSVVSASAFGTGVPHGLINLECILIAVVGMFLPRSAVFGLLFLDLLVDYAYGICYTYIFTLREFLISLRYITAMPPVRVAEGVLASLVGVILCGWLAIAWPRQEKRVLAASALLLCGMLPIAIDTVNGQNLLVRKDVTLSQYRLVRSPLVTLTAWQISAFRQESKEQNAVNAKMESASARLLSIVDSRPQNQPAPNVVLILVESWGLDMDPKIANGLTEMYSDPQITSQYQVSTGTAPFSGLTIPGEARELCQSTMGFGILNMTKEQIRQCLPTLLHARGYQSSAIHGYLGQMFYRAKWYPEIGFNRTWFKDDLVAAGLQVCKGAFPGSCDASIANWIGSSLLATDQGKPQFVYWVTLNSHLPVPADPDLPVDTVCQVQPALDQSHALCSWFRLEVATHRAIAGMAASIPTRPTIFVVVGDHAPPFGSPELRRRFSPAVVPYVILVPKMRR